MILLRHLNLPHISDFHESVVLPLHGFDLGCCQIVLTLQLLNCALKLFGGCSILLIGLLKLKFQLIELTCLVNQLKIKVLNVQLLILNEKLILLLENGVVFKFKLLTLAVYSQLF